MPQAILIKKHSILSSQSAIGAILPSRPYSWIEGDLGRAGYGQIYRHERGRLETSIPTRHYSQGHDHQSGRRGCPSTPAIAMVSFVGRTSERVKLRHVPERLVLRNDARLTNRLSKPTVVDRMISTQTTSPLQSPSLRRHRYRQGAWQLQEHYLYRAWYTTIFISLLLSSTLLWASWFLVAPLSSMA